MARRTPRQRRAGMTLIEILIVIVIMAVAAVGISFAVGALTRTRLRSSTVKVVAASRYAYNRAVSQGTTTRVVIDVDENTIAIEEAHGRVTLARMDDPRRENDESDDDEAGVDPWASAQQRLEETMRPTFGASPFSPIRGSGGEVLDRFRTQPIGNGIDVVRLILPHEPEPREHGKGSIYFFPHGMSEHAVVQLSDGTNVYSVEIHPLTGRGKVHNFAFEPEPVSEDARDEDLSEVRDSL